VKRATGVVVLAMLVVLAAACSSDGSSEEPGASPTTGPPEPELYQGAHFYDVPDPLPSGEHGDLIRYQPVTGPGPASAAVWRVMYRSESIHGDPIAVTGTALVPSGDAPSDGRRVLTVAHGGTGVADRCAPSKAPAATELALTGSFIEADYVVVMTDFEGLGTPGVHPFLVGESEGRGVLDAARAVRQLPDAAATEHVAIAGYSQGGHGALWADQLADEWAPELDVVGVFAGAPLTEFDRFIPGLTVNPAAAGQAQFVIAGYAGTYSDADPADVLTARGEQELAAVETGCVGEIIDQFAPIPAAELFEPDFISIEPWGELADENDPGQVATDRPVLIIHSAADEAIPVALSERLFQRLCDLGQVVERRVPTEGSHIGAAPQAFFDAFDWIEARFAGEKPISTCPDA
jgi:pimeloyl-ACP methyl ester carboxylesterase